MHRGDHQHERGLSADDRFAIAASAASAARANRPRGMLIVAALVFAAAGLYAVTGLASASGARRALDNQQRVLEQVRDLVLELETRAQRGALTPAEGGLCDPDPNLRSTIRSVGLSLELDVPALPDEPSPAVQDGVRQRRLTYRVNDPDIGKLMRFVRDAVAATECVSVYSLQLRPSGGQTWNMTVVFERIERAA